ncbi:hypothetical protein [Halobacillus salinus]|uniref:Competence protein ComG n=1 Tax=Halobacillus salinus TaxID=192814 RepID=A0A4Z0H1N4_9BACI|nr:hypothetical protein [Halobacillus salinus]TGB04313.1 hypothetical protein E4663_04775 [Halobacillus salinus]
MLYPWVFVLACCLIAVTFHTIYLYQNELQHTKSYQLSMISQNLLEASEHQLWERWETNGYTHQEAPYTFSFEEGAIEADCDEIEPDKISCRWSITNVEGDLSYKQTIYKNIFPHK